MSKLPRIALEQWIAFKTVVDQGSFAAAAETLNKSQSSISYAVSRLSEQLPRPVLRIQGRKAVLTPEGEVLYRHAIQLIRQAQTMEDIARSMAVNFEAEVTVALDALLDVSNLCCALEKFSLKFPHTRVRVLETSLSGTIEALLEHKAGIVIGGNIPVGFAGTPLCSVRIIPVAARNHPLFSREKISELELKSYRQVVLRDSGQRQQRDTGWLGSEQRWTVSHFSSSISLVKSGLVFAFLPRNRISAELDSGMLKQIPLPESLSRTVPMYLMESARETAGPATRELAQILVTQLQQEPVFSFG